MREKVVEHDVIDCVLGLGPNLFYNSPMEACVVVCRMSKPPARRRKVLFINAVDEVTRERAQSFLTDGHIERIVRAYRDFRDSEGFARVVPADEIRANKANLSIPLYVRAPNGNGVATSEKSLKSAIADWERSSAALRASMEEMFKTLKESGIG
jgi:type I restriction enzyme M protein